MASDQSWKEKYLQALESSDSREEQWQTERNTLERMLVRTSLASEGQSRELDCLLARVRKDLRKKTVDVEAWRELQEQAQQLLNALVLPYPVSQLVDAIERAGRVYLSQGLTSVAEAGVGGGWIGKSPVEVAAYQAARDADRLPLRVELMVAADALHPLAGHDADDLGIGLDLGIRSGLGDDRLRIGPTKVFSDGSLIGHTCALSEEFADTPGERGYLQDSAEALRWFRRAAAQRLGFEAWCDGSQFPGHDRQRLSRRAQGHPDQPRGGGLRHCAGRSRGAIGARAGHAGDVGRSRQAR